MLGKKILIFPLSALKCSGKFNFHQSFWHSKENAVFLVIKELNIFQLYKCRCYRFSFSSLQKFVTLSWKSKRLPEYYGSLITPEYLVWTHRYKQFYLGHFCRFLLTKWFKILHWDASLWRHHFSKKLFHWVHLWRFKWWYFSSKNRGNTDDLDW